MKKGNLMSKWNNYNQLVENKLIIYSLRPPEGFFQQQETGVSLIAPLQHI